RDGRKYKPLFAPLVIDLDNRVNVNVHGNVRGRGLTHASNQGWGPWEVSLRPVLPRGNEWAQLLVGSKAFAGGVGRYGPDGVPGAAPQNVASLGVAPPFYSQADYDGYNLDQSPHGASGPLLLPGNGTAPFCCFPSYALGYGNGSATEAMDHP